MLLSSLSHPKKVSRFFGSMHHSKTLSSHPPSASTQSNFSEEKVTKAEWKNSKKLWKNRRIAWIFAFRCILVCIVCSKINIERLLSNTFCCINISCVVREGSDLQLLLYVSSWSNHVWCRSCVCVCNFLAPWMEHLPLPRWQRRRFLPVSSTQNSISIKRDHKFFMRKEEKCLLPSITPTHRRVIGLVRDIFTLLVCVCVE